MSITRSLKTWNTSRTLAIIEGAFVQGMFQPGRSRIALVQAIFKKGDRGELSNSRPFRLLSRLSKIIVKNFSENLRLYHLFDMKTAIF